MIHDFFNSKFYEKLCFVYKIIVLNMIFLISIVPVVTIVPGIISLYKVCKSYVVEESNDIYSTYFKAYFKDFWRNCLVSVIWLLSIGVFAYSIFSFYTLIEFNKLYIIGVIVVSILLFLFICGCLHYPLIKTYFMKLCLFDEIKLSFIFLVKFKRRSLLMIILLILNAFLVSRIPLLIVFIGAAPVVYLIVKHLNNLYQVLVVKFKME